MFYFDTGNYIHVSIIENENWTFLLDISNKIKYILITVYNMSFLLLNNVNTSE